MLWRKVVKDACVAVDVGINHVFHVRNLAIHGGVRNRVKLKQLKSKFLSNDGSLQIDQEAITLARDNIQTFISWIGIGNL